MEILTDDITDSIEIVTESLDSGQKDHFIQGVFLQANVKNRNSRYYPQELCEQAVSQYNNEYIRTGRSLGELGHPKNPGINLHLASHKITELSNGGPNYYGKAKIIDTPMGKIAKTLINEGIKLGVSLRGTAKIERSRGTQWVKDNFSITTVDIVADPSMPDAFVEGIMENTNTYLTSGALNEMDYVYIQESVRGYTKTEIDEGKLLQLFESFMHGKALQENIQSGDINKLAKQIAKLTDQNDHTGAALLLAKYTGDKDTEGVLRFIQKRSEKNGHTGTGDIHVRKKMVKKLLNHLSPEDKKKIHKSF